MTGAGMTVNDDITRKALERLYAAFTVKGGGEDGTARSWSRRVEEALAMASVALDAKLPDLPSLLAELSVHLVLEWMEVDETTFVRFSVIEEDEEVAVILAATNPPMVQMLSQIEGGALDEKPATPPAAKPDFNVN